MRVLLSALLIASLALPTGASAETRNPDRWITADLSISGASSSKGDQIVQRPLGDVDQLVRTLNVGAFAAGIFPVSDAWTVFGSVGGDWNEIAIVGNSVFGGTAVDDSLLTYSLGARRYFLDRHFGFSDAPENPDRWPSLSLTARGSSSIHSSASNAVSTLNRATSHRNLTSDLELRLPVSNAWTMVFLGSGDRLYSDTNGTASANRVQAVQDDLALGAGFRYFFVGRNFIAKDGNKNPDRWTMLALTLTGSRSLYATQSITTPSGIHAERSTNFREYGATAEARLPITDHVSLRFDAGVGYSRAFAPLLAVQFGTITRTTTVGFGAGFRYFFF